MSQAAHAGLDARATLVELMTAEGDAIYSLCLRKLRDPEQAKDVLQRVFLEAHRDLAKFQGKAQLRTWVFGIAINRCKDAAKARDRRARWIAADDAAVDVAEAPGGGPAAQLEQRRELADLAACVAELSEDAQLAVLLRYQHGLSFEDMADVLAAKADTLQTRVRRALPALKACLERKGWTHD